MIKTSILPLVILLAANSKMLSQELLWKFKTGDRIYSSPVVDEEKAYFGSGDNFIYALNKKTGEFVWKYETDGPVHSSPAVSEDKVIVGSADGSLYCLDSDNGSLNWKFDSRGEQVYDLWDYYLSSPKIIDQSVFWASGDSSLYSIDLASGQRNWEFKTEGIIHASPEFDSTKVFIGSFDGYFYAIERNSGQLAWKLNTIGDTYFPKGEVQKAALVVDDVVYFGSRDYNIYALDTKTGTGRWNMKEWGSWIIARPTFYKGNLFFGTSDSHAVYSMDAQTGKVNWKIPTNMRVYGSAVAHDDIIYFGCFNGKLYGIDQAMGDPKWEFQTDGSKANYSLVYDESDHFREDFELYGANWMESEKKIHSLGSILCTPAIDNEVIYFGSSDGKFYAVSID